MPGDDLKNIDLNLEYMFAAAKSYIPDKADDLAAFATRTYHHLQVFNEQSALAGDPAVLTNLLQAGGETYEALRVGVTSLNHAASAVLATAKDFVETDGDAQQQFQQMDATINGVSLKDAPLTQEVVPPGLGNPSEPGAPGTDDQPPGGHPTQGGTTSTPEPGSPEDDAQDRDDQQSQSEQENPYVPEQPEQG